jgi:hypothetical protein
MLTATILVTVVSGSIFLVGLKYLRQGALLQAGNMDRSYRRHDHDRINHKSRISKLINNAYSA